MLYFHENGLMPDGRLLVDYSTDEPEQAKWTEVRLAMQDGGTVIG